MKFEEMVCGYDHIWLFEYGLELELSGDDVLAFNESSDVTDAVELLCRLPYVRRQTDKWTPEEMLHELRELGEWNEEQLKSAHDNVRRLVLVAAGNIFTHLKVFMFERSRDLVES